MKKKFYSLLLTAVFGLTGMNAWADNYEIATAQDLMDFAEVVNSGELEANAVLTADIDMSGYMEDEWTAIGDWGTVSGTASAGFKGHFDGQGHTIKNFNFTATHNYFALFGVIWGTALVENFTIEGNITVNDAFQYVAGVVAYTNNTPTIRNVHSKVNINSTSTVSTPRLGGVVGGIPAQNSTTTVDRCTYSGTLNTNDKGGNYGGIVGYILNNNTTKANITNCLFDGKILSENTGSAQLGGLIGYTRKGIVSVKNCLSVGTIEYNDANASNIGQFVGRITYDSGNTGLTFANNYYKNTGIPVAGTSGGVGKGTAPLEVTAAELATGEIAYKLNENVSGGKNWFQKLKTKTFVAEQYVVTTNGTSEAPTTADITLSEASDGTFTFTLPEFKLKIIGRTYDIGTISLTGVEINDNGTFNQTGTYAVPDENIPAELSAYALYFKNIQYTLQGKVNNENDKFYAEVDLTVMGQAVNVVAGEDNFTAAAPAGDAYPTPNGTAIVYLNGRSHCDGSAYEGADGYTNTPAEKDDHDFVDGFCTYCGAFDVTYMAANSDGFYEIGNAAQLKWFAAYVNQVDVTANAILVDDIDMTDVEWRPIGIGSGNVAPGATAYAGIFDGQDFSITGFNAEGAGHIGLFGDTKGATIKNFSISGTLTVTGDYGGGVVGWPINSTIENVHSSLIIDVPNSGTHHVGGVVGSARGGNTISKCSYDGIMTVESSTDNFAGVAAYITTGDKVIDCANYSDITYKNANCAAGGVVGYLNSQDAYVQNCLTTGLIFYDGTETPKYGGAILGRTKGYDAAKVTNNYWLEGTAAGASKKDDGSDPLETGSVTIDELISGEVAYKLGEAWNQEIGTDEYPLLGTDTPVLYVGAAGYATMFDTTSGYELVGDVTAYVATTKDTWLELTAIEGVPESTPVILKGTYYNKFEQDLPAITVPNELLGTEEDTEADGTMYILAKPEGMEVGFYLATGIIPAGKAYYKSTSGVKGFLFAEDGATGIKDLKDSNDSNDLIYNLAGQRLQKMQKGINIVGNKKVLK